MGAEANQSVAVRAVLYAKNAARQPAMQADSGGVPIQTVPPEPQAETPVGDSLDGALFVVDWEFWTAIKQANSLSFGPCHTIFQFSQSAHYSLPGVRPT